MYAVYLWTINNGIAHGGLYAKFETEDDARGYCGSVAENINIRCIHGGKTVFERVN